MPLKLNMGGVIGVCSGHHSSLSDAIQVEVLGAASNEFGKVINIADDALAPANFLAPSAPITDWLAELDKWSKTSPEFFTGKAIVLDVSKLAANRSELRLQVSDRPSPPSQEG